LLILRWWKTTVVGEKLAFVRDRLVECFVWNVGINYKPEFEYFRKVSTMVNAFITIIDDIYDVHGTLEELELFTKAIDRLELFNRVFNIYNILTHFIFFTHT
jgi:(-)-alpha-terpineol synthase